MQNIRLVKDKMDKMDINVDDFIEYFKHNYNLHYDCEYYNIISQDNESDNYKEGSVVYKHIKQFERNNKARAKAIESNGYDCYVCGIILKIFMVK